MADVVILIPAAGASSRMRGRDKLLEEVNGIPLIARQARRTTASGLPVLITLPREDQARRVALQGVSGLEIRTLDDASEGMSASLRAGAAWAEERGARGLMVLPADMPEIDTPDLTRMRAAFLEDADRILRATDQDGREGHPVILPARLLPEVKTLRGDRGAGGIVAREVCLTHPLPGFRATLDLDTPEAWTAWRAGATEM